MSEPTSAIDRLLQALEELAGDLPARAGRERAGPVAPVLDHHLALWREQEMTAVEFLRRLYRATFEHLTETGMNWRPAAAIALRCTRLAWSLLAGYEQKEAASFLGKHERTAKEDAGRLREVFEAGRLEPVAGRRLPPIPLPPGSRIRPMRPPPRRRKRTAA